VSYNDWLDTDVLEAYLDGKLDAKAMHDVERRSLEDPFVAQALEGLSRSPKRTLALSLLQKQLQERIAQKPAEQKRWRITSHRLSIAATAAVLFITVSLLFWMRENNRRTLTPETQSAATVKPAVPLPAEKAETPVVEKATTGPAIEKTKTDQVIEEAKAHSYAGVPKKNNAIKAKENASPVRTTVTTQPELKAESAILNEVAIVAAERKELKTEALLLKSKVSGITFPRAVPVGGQAKFDTWLLENNRLAVNKIPRGKIVPLLFELQPNGTPVNIRIAPGMPQSLTDEERDEAISLMQKGPKWEPANKDNAAQTYYAEIKI